MKNDILYITILQEMYNNPFGVPHADLGAGGGGGGGGGEQPPALEELVYQEGVGYSFHLF